jgi:uncharacterized hydrophobic protein (TIGR00271 family)
MKQFITKILNFIDLQIGENDKGKVIENIVSNISFRGSNLWILACAIVIASIGLNVNSTAVVIGAMLISPLMGPIVGAGFGLGMHDIDLIRKSIKNLIIATLVSLFVSTFYFYLSPFKEIQSEILARTSPNIYDILIAFFGGLVGVIAVTRVEKGNPIPGVAIATALMPPLCSAGYSLAVGNYTFFVGALFLYFINCVFICLSTFIIVKYLNYPILKQIDNKHQKQVKYGVTILLLLMIVPSIYFAYKLYDEKTYNQKIETFIRNEFTEKDYTVIYKKTNYKTNPKKIELAFISKRFKDVEIKVLNKKLLNYGITNTLLKIKQDTINLKDDILNEINNSKKTDDQKDIIINQLKKRLVESHFNNSQIFKESKILFPEINSVSIANHPFNEYTNESLIIPVVLYQSENSLKEETSTKLKLWLKQRLQKDTIIVLRH